MCAGFWVQIPKFHRSLVKLSKSMCWFHVYKPLWESCYKSLTEMISTSDYSEVVASLPNKKHRPMLTSPLVAVRTLCQIRSRSMSDEAYFCQMGARINRTLTCRCHCFSSIHRSHPLHYGVFPTSFNQRTQF